MTKPPASESHHHRHHMDRSYFEAMYRHDEDPWGFENRWYEQRKYDLTLALLPNRRYRHAFEPGCANGVLTERLAERCDRITACDFIAATVDRARRRLVNQPAVTIDHGVFPDHWPDEGGDLAVWSEIGYYLKPEGRVRAVAGLRRWLEPGGHLMAVHYTGETNYPLTGRAVSEWIDSIEWLQPVTRLRDASFEAVVWVHDP